MVLARHEAELKRRLHQLVETLSVADFRRDDDHERSPSQRTTLATTVLSPEDTLRLTMRRRLSLTAGQPDHDASAVDKAIAQLLHAGLLVAERAV